MKGRKAGRPRLDDPMKTVTVRLDAKLLRIADEYAAEHNTTRAAAIREGILRLRPK